MNYHHHTQDSYYSFFSLSKYRPISCWNSWDIMVKSIHIPQFCCSKGQRPVSFQSDTSQPFSVIGQYFHDREVLPLRDSNLCYSIKHPFTHFLLYLFDYVYADILFLPAYTFIGLNRSQDVTITVLKAHFLSHQWDFPTIVPCASWFFFFLFWYFIVFSKGQLMLVCDKPSGISWAIQI